MVVHVVHLVGFGVPQGMVGLGPQAGEIRYAAVSDDAAQHPSPIFSDHLGNSAFGTYHRLVDDVAASRISTSGRYQYNISRLRMTLCQTSYSFADPDMLTLDPKSNHLPKRSELPEIPGAPKGAAWFWGKDDNVRNPPVSTTRLLLIK